MLVYTAEIRVPDNATYYEIQEAQINAEWKFRGQKQLRKEQMERTSLSGKCGSCKHFTEMSTLTSRCYGKCEKGRAGYKPRSCKACKLYERRVGEE
jgi:hypothetical protein